MQKNITNMLDYLPVYMKAALKKEEILLNDLYFLKRHTDIEYTNIAAVMMQRSNAQYVMSIDNWKKVFPEIMEIQKNRVDRIEPNRENNREIEEKLHKSKRDGEPNQS